MRTTPVSSVVGKANWALEPLSIYVVASESEVWKRHIGIPHRLNQRIHADSAWIPCTAGIGRRRLQLSA